jgi:hypothetical protein
MALAIAQLRKDVQQLSKDMTGLTQRVAKLEQQGAKPDLAGVVSQLQRRVKGLRRRVSELGSVDDDAPSEGKDNFGARFGTKRARANAVLTATPKTMRQIMGEAELSDTIYNHMKDLIARGFVKRVGGGYCLTELGMKVKAGAVNPPMPSPPDYGKVLADLRQALAGLKPGQKTYDEIVAHRGRVLAMYGPIFSPGHIADLTKEEFTSFLDPRNNRHWEGLRRKGLGAAEDMDNLLRALAILLNEGRPIRERFPQALDMVTGMGKGLATAILTVAYPDKYGVWNNTSEAALRKTGLWAGLGLVALLRSPATKSGQWLC